MLPSPASVWRNPIHFLAFGFGLGTAPVAPGTFGTLAALPFFWLMSSLALPTYLAVLLALGLVGIWLCHVTSRDLGVHDHSGIVWDEIVGYLITLAAVPPGWEWLLVGFVLFRFFDILKPWPISWLDKQVHGGLGIMLDDVLAGIFAWAVLQGLVVWLGP
ncbi:MAG: phosphatidylglycerophosphatase A [Gammaproteobacteria bacterium]|nr:phosphatidylglycerophosphatase A [Gammaproteobacteria bacterium]